MKKNIFKRFGAGILSAVCAASMFATNFSAAITAGAANDDIATYAASTYDGFPEADAVIKKAAEVLGAPYTFGVKGIHTSVFSPYDNGTFDKSAMLTASEVKSRGIDCAGLVYWVMASLGYKTSGFAHQNPVPPDTNHWFLDINSTNPGDHDYSKTKITYNGKTYTVEVQKNMIAAKSRNYYDIGSGKTISEGSVVVAYDNGNSGKDENHAWIYVGDFKPTGNKTSRDMVVDYLKSIGVPASSITNKTVVDTGNGETHWRIESSGGGVTINNGVDAKGHNENQIYISVYRITSEPEDAGAIQITKSFILADGTTAPANFYTQVSFRIKNSSGQYLTLTQNSAAGGIYQYNGTATSAAGATTVKLGTTSRIATINELPLGNYTVEEVLTGNIFRATVTSKTATISAASTSTTVAFENTELSGAIEIQKTTEGGDNIAGIGFTLSGTSTSGRAISKTGKTDANGKLTFTNIPVGSNYTITEDGKTVPTGYLTADPIKGVTVTYNTTTQVEVKNNPTDVEISKKAITGDNELPGAKLQVIDSTGKVVAEWTSTDKPHILKGVLEAGSTYTLHEEIAPDGYTIANDITFTVSDDGKVDTVVMRDKPTTVHLSKKKITGDDELPGAKLQVIDSTGKVVEEWISTTTPHEIVAKLIAGATYTLHEEAAPDGYAYAQDVPFTVSSNGEVDTVVMVDAPTHIVISKKALTGEDELPGAKLQVLDSTGKVVEEWTSTDKSHEIIGKLIAGETYILHEVSSPAGYTVAQDIPFVVSKNGDVDQVVMRDKPTTIYLSKKKITGEDELPGATMQVIDSNGTVIEEWISTDTPHVIEAKLIAGAIYILHEEAAPDGYAYAKDVSFTVSSDGSVDIVEMRDEPTHVKVSKKKITGDDELPGAKLQVIDSTGKVVEEWISTNEPHDIVAKLIAGATYTLHEEIAPDGYVIANDITFTVSTDGEIDVVVMRDAPTTIYLSKKKITGDDELPGAKLQVIDENGKVVDEWTSGNAPHHIEGKLIAGKKYKLHEEIAPAGYVVANDVEFTVSSDGSVDTVVMRDDIMTGSISVQKKTEGMLNLEGIKLTLSGTSLVGIKVSMTATTDENGIATFDAIPVGTYTITEDGETVPYGYLTADPIEGVEVTYAETTTVEIFNDEMTGSISVQKKTEGMLNLEGITFILSGTSDTGREIRIEAVTNENGHAVFKEIPIGTYTITEDGESVPYGYLTADPVEGVEVVYADVTTVEIFNDEMTGSISVQKKTEGMLNLEGIEFVLAGTSDTGRLIEIRVATDENGLAVFEEIPVGTYTITEDGETVPYGYLTADPIEGVEVVYADVTPVEVFNDELTGTLHITKRTSDNNANAISGIDFILTGTSDTGRQIELTATTDKDGNAWFNSIPVGTYTITEVGSTVPTGYLVADPVEGVEIIYAEQTDLVITNKDITRDEDTTPKTGDDTTKNELLAVALISIVGIYVLKRRKDSNIAD